MAKMRMKSKAAATESKAGRGRPRCPEAHASILKAAQDLLEKGGIGALSIEAVAKRAGVAKTTIYRWWPTRGALAIDVFVAIAGKRSPFPKTGSAIEGFKQQMQALAKLFRGNLGRAAAAILAEAQADDETRQAFIDRYLVPRRAAGWELFKRGITTGEIRSDLDLEVVADVLYGPIYLRLLLRHAPLNDEAIEKLLSVVVEGLRPQAIASAAARA